MTSLQDRFDVVQQELMDIYENADYTLDTQIKHWELLRKEHVLLYSARQRGLSRLGFRVVPPLKVSENKAKQAIGMSLHLQSLKLSPYGNERWTLQETSAETFDSPPMGSFKKHPKLVTVVYDGNPMNAMEYTAYSYIYMLADDDVWHKYTSDVDYDGVYYLDAEGNKNYYVNFHEDAQLFSKLGQWEVRYANSIFSAPVTSSQSADRPPGRPIATEGDHSAGSSSSPTAAGRQQPESSGRPASRGPDQSHRRSRSRSRSRSHSRHRSASPDSGESRRSTRSSSTEPSTTAQRQRLRQRHGRRGSPSSGRATPPAAWEVGGRHRSPARAAETRLERLISEARDPPIILVRGPQNSLKCWRNRCRIRWPGYFQSMSTTFTWISSQSIQRAGLARMLISFNSVTQRELFLKHVKLPKNTSYVFGFLDGL